MRQTVNPQTIYVKNDVNIRFDIPHGVNVTITVFWDVTPYSLVRYQGLKRYILPHSSVQKTEAAGSSETPVTIYYLTAEKMETILLVYSKCS